jgi:hypothetical protein
MTRSLARASLGALACALLACSAAYSTPADAAVTHEFLPALSKTLSEGVPGPPREEAPLTGPVFGVNALTTDSGHLWVAERVQSGLSRVDAFDDSSGAFLPPQFGEEGGVSSLETGVAVGHPGGEQQVYVGAAQEGKGVVAVFGPTGKLQSAWTGANTPNGSFTESEGARVGFLTGVAVDSSASLETGGAVYVSVAGFIPSFSVVEVFKPQAGGAEPAKVLGQIKGPETPCVAGQPACVNPGTEEPCKEEEGGVSEAGCVTLFSEPTGVAVSGFNGDVLVTDSNRVVDVFEPTVLGEYHFVRQLTATPTGPAEEEAAFQQVVSVAVDGANGDVYVAEAGAEVIDEFDAQGNYLGRLTGTSDGPFKSLKSLAVDSASHDVYVGDFDSEAQTAAIDAFGPELVIPDVRTLAPSNLTPHTAQLNGTIDPDGAGAASCQFLWGETNAFGHVANCPMVPNGEEPVPVSAALTGLAPDTTYFYRLQSGNENATNLGEPFQDQSFTTPGPGIRAQWASDVSATSATLNAQVDPHGAATEYFFEYGPSTKYGLTVPQPAAAVGSGEEHVEQHVQGLMPNTVYHFRAVVVSELEVEGVLQRVEVAGPDQTFVTQGPGSGLALPDGRRWELVSPPDKHGALLEPISEVGVIQSATSGGTVSYPATLPTEAQVQGNGEGVQVLSTRASAGWSSQDVSLPHASVAGTSVGFGHEYRAFSADLSLAMVEPLGEFTSLAPEVFPPDTERTPYIRHDATCASEPARCYEPLLTSAPGYADVQEATKFGGQLQIHGPVNFVGATPNLAHAVISSTVALTATPTGEESQLYEWSAGRPPSQQLQLLSVLPEGAGPPPRAAHLGSQDQNVRHAISDDGSRVIWSEVEGHLYMRENASEPQSPLDGQGRCTVPADACTVQLDTAQPGAPAGGAAHPQFQIASRDGSRVFFSDSQPLTKDASTLPGKADLYECEMVPVEGKLQCKLSDLTPLGSGKAADVQGALAGASEDGSWLYFVANGVLAEGAVPGACNGDSSPPGARCNLYVWHDGATRLVAVLSGEDAPDWANGVPQLNVLTARVAPGGQWLAFMSQRSLTGYDNLDANSPPTEPHHDEEVYLYNAADGHLACASCDPSGARPVGVEYASINGKLAGGDRVWPLSQWIAANVPGWTPYRQQQAVYQSRYLSDEGRLFFNSSDALAAQDINANEDVYEYEPPGVGDCSSSSSSFDQPAGGCVGLVSSGTAAGESAFLDASESGDDVFFLTGGRLLPDQDVDNALDVYDAHVCPSAASCPSSSGSSPPCATADACRSGPSPQPQIFGAPASSTFSGPGNLAPPPPRPRLTRAQKLAKALAACHRKYKRSTKQARRRRRACERRAQKLYGARPHKPRASKGGRA